MDFDRDQTFFECDTCSEELVEMQGIDESLFTVVAASERETPPGFNYNTLGLTPESASHVLSTPADIARTYGPAIIVHRWVARIIDNILLVVPVGVVGLIGGEVGFAAAGLLLLVGQFFYFGGMDGVRGCTIGKQICGLRVVNAEGQNPGFEKGLIRSLACLIEMNPLFFGALPAAVIALVSGTRQRLGDSFAKTYVIKAIDLHLIEHRDPLSQGRAADAPN